MAGAPRSLAVLGGSPAFATELPVGQMYFPPWEAYEEAFRALFDREYYTNHGPMAREAEARLAEVLDVEHALCVTNATIGLMMAAKALDLRGRVITPAFTFVATAQALTWAGLEPVFCDVSRTTHQMTPDLVAPLLDDSITAIHPVNLWGGTCGPSALEALARAGGVHLYFDSAQAFGCRTEGRPVGSFGALEVFSFHATKILGTGEGACITTNDGDLAERLRNIRSSYDIRSRVAVPVTTNGRFSEAQAVLCLLSLDEYEGRRRHNISIRDVYRAGLADVPGIDWCEPSGVETSNEQYAVCEVHAEVFAISRNVLLQSLKAEGVNVRRYFYPGVHRVPPYTDGGEAPSLPNTDHLCDTVLQLPLGALVTPRDADRIVELINEIHAGAEAIAHRLRS